MNVIFYITPKSLTKYLLVDMTIRQVLEVFEHYRYTVIPLLDNNGKYIGTVSEGDLLFFLKDHPFSSIKEFDNVSVSELKRNHDYKSIDSHQEMEDIIQMSLNQNFVPMLDDRNNFIGIITRQTLIQYLHKNENK